MTILLKENSATNVTIFMHLLIFIMFDSRLISKKLVSNVLFCFYFHIKSPHLCHIQSYFLYMDIVMFCRLLIKPVRTDYTCEHTIENYRPIISLPSF